MVRYSRKMRNESVGQLDRRWQTRLTQKRAREFDGFPVGPQESGTVATRMLMNFEGDTLRPIQTIREKVAGQGYDLSATDRRAIARGNQSAGLFRLSFRAMRGSLRILRSCAENAVCFYAQARVFREPPARGRRGQSLRARATGAKVRARRTRCEAKMCLKSASTSASSWVRAPSSLSISSRLVLIALGFRKTGWMIDRFFFTARLLHSSLR